MKPKIHIVSFDVPYPADYGGVIDVYHRCKALTDFGYEVHLHCFEYGRGKPNELQEVAHKVYFYTRKSNFSSLFSKSPAIVESRYSELLISNLKSTPAPIILEGQHTTGILPQLKNYKHPILIRSHNVEHDYYRELAKIETSAFKKVFFKREARLLQRQEILHTEVEKVLTVSHKDTDYFNSKFGNAYFLPVANSLSKGNRKEFSTKPYILIHGNMSVKENQHSVEQAIKDLKSKHDFELIVAGKNPPQELTDLVNSTSKSTIIPSPSDEILHQLIAEASANLLITNQSTGIKHKLINALANGGHLIANDKMVEGTGLSQFCTIANSDQEIVEAIKQAIATEVDKDLIDNRLEFLESNYGLKKHAQQIHEIIEQSK